MKKIKKLEKINQNAEIVLPSSKSYLNRALILASLQKNKIILTNVCNICDDVIDMISALQKLGIKIEIKENKNGKIDIVVFGNGGKFSKPSNNIINCGLGGTTTRFILGLSALFDFDITITAEGKMLERPIDELFDFLKNTGKEIVFLKNQNCLPVIIKHSIGKNTKKIKIDGSKSSQFLSSIMMVADALNIEEIEVKNLVSKSYINITLDVLQQFGINFVHHKNDDTITYTINKASKQQQNNIIEIEQDYSSASYFLAIQTLFNADKNIVKVSPNSSQGDAKFINVIQKIEEYKNTKKYQKPLVLQMQNMPDVSLTAMVLCAFQDFNTKITGLKTLKNKECNRLKAMHDELAKIGIKTKISPSYDIMTIYGKSSVELKNDIKIETYNDHRIAMCFAIVGAKLGHIIIEKPDVVNKSFPNFWQEFEKIYCE